MQPHISRILSTGWAPLPPRETGSSGRKGEGREGGRAAGEENPPPNKWRLKQTKDGGGDGGVCLLSVLARTESNLLLRLRRPPPSPAAFPPRGRGIKKKYRRRIFVSVSQTILLNGSRESFSKKKFSSFSSSPVSSPSPFLIFHLWKWMFRDNSFLFFQGRKRKKEGENGAIVRGLKGDWKNNYREVYISRYYYIYRNYRLTMEGYRFDGRRERYKVLSEDVIEE